MRLLAAYLATKPTGGNLILLVVAVVLFLVSGFVATMEKAFYAALIAAGLAAFALAFLVS